MATSSITAVQELATIFTFDAKTGDITVAQREVSRLRQTISGLSATTDRAERSMAGMGRRLVAVLGGAMLARRFFESNRELERLDVTMRSVSGSAAEAGDNFRFILDWAARTPFDIRQVTRSFVALRAQGIRPTLEMFNGIGNLSSALGSDFANLILAAQRAAQGRTQRLQQAILAPVSLSNNGRTLTVMFRGIAHEVDVAENGTERVLELLAQIGNENFGGQMTELINRLDGAMSNFGDIVDIVLFDVGSKSGLNSSLVEMIQNLTTMIGKTKGLAIALGRALTVPLRLVSWLLGKANENAVTFNRALTLISLVMGTLITSTAVYWFGRLASAIFMASRAAALLHLAFLPLTAAILVLEDLFTFFRGGDSVFGRWTKDVGPLGQAARSLADTLRPLFTGEGLEFSAIVERIVRAADTVFSEVIPAFWQAMYDHMPGWMRRLLDLLGITGGEGAMPENIGSGGADVGDMGSLQNIEEQLARARERLARERAEAADAPWYMRDVFSGRTPGEGDAWREVRRLEALREERRREVVAARDRTARQAMHPQVQRGLRSIVGQVTSVGDLFGGPGNTTSGFAMAAVANALNRARNVTMTVGAVNVEIDASKSAGIGEISGAQDALGQALRQAVHAALTDVAEDMENRAGSSQGVLE